MSISSGEGTHVKELMRRTRRFLDGVEAEEAEKERLQMLRKAAMGGGGGGDAEEEGEGGGDSWGLRGCDSFLWLGGDCV